MRFCTTKRSLVKVIEYGKSEVSLQMDIKFLVMPGTTRTSFKERCSGGKITNMRNWDRGTISNYNTILTRVRSDLIKLCNIICHVGSCSRVCVPFSVLAFIDGACIESLS